jgi:hypothetical protein
MVVMQQSRGWSMNGGGAHVQMPEPAHVPWPLQLLCGSLRFAIVEWCGEARRGPNNKDTFSVWGPLSFF